MVRAHADGVPKTPGLGRDNLTLENGHNTASREGGAITHNVGGRLTVSDSTLADNAGKNGGAIDNNDATSGASLSIIDSTLTGNSAPDGGAIDNDDHSVTLAPQAAPGPPAHRGPPGRCPGRAPDTSPADT